MSRKHQKSIVREALDRLDSLMAIGESRREAKQKARSEAQAEGESFWSFSTGRLHSYKTRSVYQEQTLRFLNWCRSTHQLTCLADVDLCADALATEYLAVQLANNKSPYTLQTERSALRLFFGNRTLASSLAIPRRTRTTITRSREPVAHDRYFQPANWLILINFLQATGLRRGEVRVLRVGDIADNSEHLVVRVLSGKGGKAREVPVLAGYEADVRTAITDRPVEAFVFSRIPKHLDVHSYRRKYAQALYLQYAPSGQVLPSNSAERLQASDYNEEAVLMVSWALGHNRKDVVLKHYLR